MTLQALRCEDGSQHPVSSGRDNSSKLIAIIVSASTEPSMVLFHEFQASMQHPQSLPGVDGYTYLTHDASDEHRADPHVGKAFAKNRKSSERLCRLREQQGHRQTPSDIYRSGEKSEESDLPTTSLGPEAFASRVGAQKDRNPIMDVFNEIQLRYWNGFTSTQHIHVRNSRQVGNLIEFRDSTAGCIVISTGMCLFSKALVSALSTSAIVGHDVCHEPSLSSRTQLTLYELEITIKLSSTIADVIGLLQTDEKLGMSSVTVNVDITYLTCNIIGQHSNS